MYHVLFPERFPSSSYLIGRKVNDDIVDWESHGEAIGGVYLSDEQVVHLNINLGDEENEERYSLLRLLEILSQENIYSLRIRNAVDSDMTYISSWNNMRQIDLSFTRVTCKGLLKLKHLYNIRSISLAYTNMNNISLKDVLFISHLREINLMQSCITGNDINGISGAKNLNWLNISSNNLSGIEIRSLGDALGIKHLVMNGMMKKVDLRNITYLKSLEFLELKHCVIDTESLSHISFPKSIKEIQLIGSDLSKEDISKIRKALPDAIIRL